MAHASPIRPTSCIRRQTPQQVVNGIIADLEARGNNLRRYDLQQAIDRLVAVRDRLPEEE